MHAVASVVLNRVAKPGWWGHSITSVCLCPFQFSAWNDNDPNLTKLRSVTSADKEFMVALRVAAEAAKGRLPDITHGATSYKVTSLPWPHSWGPERPPLVTIGAHSFYNLETPLSHA